MFESLEAKAIALFAAAAVAFCLGWGVNGWRLNADIDALKLADAKALAAANADVARKQQALDAAQAQTADALSKIDTTGTAKLKDLQDENDRLRAATASGAQRVYVRATCPAVSVAGVPKAPASGSVDSGPGPELTADARQSYFNFRAGYSKQFEQLTACQASLRALTGQ